MKPLQCPVTGKTHVPVDLFDPQFIANPYPTYARLREDSPVQRITLENDYPVWLVTRYDDVMALLKDDRVTKVPGKALPADGALPEMPFESIDAMAMLSNHMLMMDPPDHTRIRTLVHKAFTPRHTEQLRPRVQQIADELIDKIIDKGSMDLIDDFAFPLPLTVIAELLGIPIEHHEMFRKWSNLLTDGYTTAENLPQVQEATHGFIHYLQQIFTERRANPGNDLISALVAVEETGDRLSEQELLSMVFLLFLAGHETTVNLIGNGMLALLQHPAQLQLLREKPELIESAVEEMLRYDASVATSTVRFAMEDIAIGGVVIPRGEEIMLMTGAANHDEKKFDQPGVFDITRTDNRHISFGHGIHFCLGAPLARLEGAVAVSTLLRRLPDIKLAVAPETLIRRPSMLIRGVQQLPVVF
ncbi:cytochrome P450 family protein [Chitinophaga nivalis]|uniref:Cytochrome P450 n=1 Tax=Chitinophaga nivalis TaxID=2991709 RepID=A0ABT3IJ16_9BACT|nr:cytochrome P450 [Chitinophaga nivalis]MCW3466353.1 cytochrome P450 [Chitinophaga nivalis]MCW3483956.1 cytochrome P450 [Chitinophaga nivalis]